MNLPPFASLLYCYLSSDAPYPVTAIDWHTLLSTMNGLDYPALASLLRSSELFLDYVPLLLFPADFFDLDRLHDGL